jgi:DNA-binding XRE family transcriptional regulator
MAKKKTDVAVKEDNRPATGRGGKYNFPNARMKLIEQDDEKRAFMAKCIENNLVFFNIGLEPAKSDDELCERLDFFFMECARTQQLPTLEKMANCIGYHRQTLYDWENGLNKGFSPQTSIIIKKAKQILASMDAELAAEGRIQPVVYLFRSKNFYGMKDQQEMVVTPNQNLSDTDIQNVANKYKALPEDEED